MRVAPQFGQRANEIFVGSSVASMTTAIQDAFSASYAGPYDVQLIAGSALQLVAFDEDVSVQDFAYGCIANPITAANLRARNLSCTSAAGSLSYTLRPK